MSEQGAIDQDFDDAERPYEEQVAAALKDVQTELMPGDVAMDLVTRQPLFVRAVEYESLEAHYEDNGFCLASYNEHPFLPGVDLENRVLECVFVEGPKGAHNQSRTYSYPEGRLMRVPVDLAWRDAEVGDV